MPMRFPSQKRRSVRPLEVEISTSCVDILDSAAMCIAGRRIDMREDEERLFRVALQKRSGARWSDVAGLAPTIARHVDSRQ